MQTTISTVTRADHVPGPPQGNWTYNDYLAIPDDGRRYEILGGVLYMAPAPNPAHQEIADETVRWFLVSVKDKGLGRVFSSPIDVTLSAGNVMQPDVVVILKAHNHRVTDKGIEGPPDLVVEVASRSIGSYDRREKRRAYEAAGIPEYWLVDPTGKNVELLVFENGEYQSKGTFAGEDVVASVVVPTLDVPVRKFFQ